MVKYQNFPYLVPMLITLALNVCWAFKILFSLQMCANGLRRFKPCLQAAYLYKTPLPPYWLLLGSPGLMDPHLSHHNTDLHHTVLRPQRVAYFLLECRDFWMYLETAWWTPAWWWPRWGCMTIDDPIKVIKDHEHQVPGFEAQFPTTDGLRRTNDH